MKRAVAGENLADEFECAGDEKLAYKIYKALASYRNPHTLRCYVDMLMAGKGTNKDIKTAMRTYQLAADGGNPTAMFVMGEKARNENNLYLAACWYRMAYVRGLGIAGQRFTQLKT